MRRDMRWFAKSIFGIALKGGLACAASQYQARTKFLSSERSEIGKRQLA